MLLSDGLSAVSDLQATRSRTIIDTAMGLLMMGGMDQDAHHSSDPRVGRSGAGQ
jgi:hypothetical protein